MGHGKAAASGPALPTARQQTKTFGADQDLWSRPRPLEQTKAFGADKAFARAARSRFKECPAIGDGPSLGRDRQPNPIRSRFA
jgi:hypothetical protein